MTTRETAAVLTAAAEAAATIGLKIVKKNTTLLESDYNADKELKAYVVTYVMFEYSGKQYQAYKTTGSWSISEYNPEEPAYVEVELLAFTGMVIDKCKATFVESANGYEVTLKDGRLMGFDAAGTQIGAKNPKFANKIRISKEASK